MFNDWDKVLEKGQGEALKQIITSIQSYALWVTLALAVILIAAAILVKFKFPDKMRGYALTAVGIAVGYAVALVSVLLYLQISRMVVKQEINAYFYVVVGLFAFAIVAVIVNVFVKLFAPKAFKYTLCASLALFAAYVIVILCVFPTVNNEDEGNFTPKNNAAYIITAIILVSAILFLSIFFDRKKGAASPTKQLAYAGVCTATAFALSYVKFFSLPLGGSVTLVSMLPIMLYAYMFGAKKGVLVGVIYGLLQLIQSPQIYEPLQVMLDYPIAFGALGLAGIFKDMKGLKGNMFAEFLLGMIVACFGRYVAHVLSGYFVFYSWGWAGREFAYSLAYNSFVLVDLAIDIAVGAVILASPAMRKQIANVNPVLTETTNQTVAENN